MEFNNDEFFEAIRKLKEKALTEDEYGFYRKNFSTEELKKACRAMYPEKFV